MIASLSGVLEYIGADGAVIDVSGVGYHVNMPTSALAALPGCGRTVRVLTYLAVREDAMTLYGFSTAEERDIFAILLGVSGIGPKGALAALSVCSPDQLRAALATEDLDTLTMIPGIGRKTAARMVLELREKLALPALDVVPGGNGAARATFVEVKGALLSLGYSTAEARGALDALPADATTASTEDVLKLALKELARV